MSVTDDLYREIILEHFKNPRNHGRLSHPDLTAQGANPFCGDELEVTVQLEKEKILEIQSQGKGCSISQASASMMTESLQGKTVEEAEKIAQRFKMIMLEGAPFDLPAEFEDLQSLDGVKKYPVRIKCAILGWNTLLEGIEAHRKGKSVASHVEGEEGEHPALSKQLVSDSPLSDQTAAGGVSDTVLSFQEEVLTALKEVIDPELNMNVVDLGLVYGTEIRDGEVKVTYTLTSPGCPLGPVIKGQMTTVLGRILWIKKIETLLVWNPPWDPKTMASEEVKTELGIW